MPEFPQACPKKIWTTFCGNISHGDRFWNKKSFHVILHTLGANFVKPKHVGRHFCRIFRKFAQIFWGFAKVFTDFAQISADFADFQEFCPDFHHIKFFGVRLHPASLRH